MGDFHFNHSNILSQYPMTFYNTAEHAASEHLPMYLWTGPRHDLRLCMKMCISLEQEQTPTSAS